MIRRLEVAIKTWSTKKLEVLLYDASMVKKVEKYVQRGSLLVQFSTSLNSSIFQLYQNWSILQLFGQDFDQIYSYSYTLWALSVDIFNFRVSRPSKFSSMGSPVCIMFWSLKYTFTCQRWHFQAYHRYLFST